MALQDALDGATEAVDAKELIASLQAALNRSRRELARVRHRDTALVEAVRQGAHDAQLLIQGSPVPSPAVSALGSAAGGTWVALWDLGDWQGTKITPSYNTLVMQQRVRQYIAEANAVTEDLRNVRRIETCHVVFGGDMIEGLWNYPTQAWEVEEEPITQVVIVAALMVEVIQGALATHAHVDVTAEWGNHGRIGSKRDGIPSQTNLDRMAFILARQTLAKEIEAGRVVWGDSLEDIQRLQIGAYRALVIHGDEIGRTGYASPSTIVNHANRWRTSYPWDFKDVYVHHYHTPMELTLADGDGRVFFNGATESDNRYALVGMAASGVPTQRLHFIDPVAGRVALRYDVVLTTPEPAPTHPSLRLVGG